MRADRHAVVLYLVAALLVAGCATADPYGVFPDASRVERIVAGSSALQVQDPRPGSDEYLVFEGVPMSGGGIIWKPFYLTDVPVPLRVGNAIQARKARWAEVFGLLARGAAGENAENRLVPRVGLGELTERERFLLDAENRDRAIILAAIQEGRRIPEADVAAAAVVFSQARHKLLPDGLWIEARPGRWIVKGGSDYRSRVMSREPILLSPEPDAALEPMPEPELEIQAPRPRLRR